MIDNLDIKSLQRDMMNITITQATDAVELARKALDEAQERLRVEEKQKRDELREAQYEAQRLAAQITTDRIAAIALGIKAKIVKAINLQLPDIDVGTNYHSFVFNKETTISYDMKQQYSGSGRFHCGNAIEGKYTITVGDSTYRQLKDLSYNYDKIASTLIELYIATKAKSSRVELDIYNQEHSDQLRRKLNTEFGFDHYSNIVNTTKRSTNHVVVTSSFMVSEDQARELLTFFVSKNWFK